MSGHFPAPLRHAEGLRAMGSQARGQRELPTDEFKLPWPWAVLFVALQLPFMALTLMAWPQSPIGASIFLVVFLLYAWLPIWGSHVSVGPEGINLFRSSYKVAWSDISSAQLRSILGLRHMRLARTRGWTLWLPLYYVGNRRMEDVLRDRAPKDNPIQRCLDRS
jgi:hypothetical protein